MRIILLILAGFLLIYFSRLSKTDLEKELERFANRKDVQIIELGNNMLKIEYPTQGYAKYVDISDQNISVEEATQGIQVFDLTTTPDSLFEYRYTFKNRIPIGQSHGNPLVFYDFDNNGKIDVAGAYKFVKDNNLVRGGILELQEDGVFTLQHLTAISDTAQQPLSVTDVDKDGFIELNIKTTQHFRNYETVSQDSFPKEMRFDHEMWQFSSIGSTEFFTYFDSDSLLDVFYVGDDTLSPWGNKLYIAEYDPVKNNFVQKFRFPPPEWNVGGVSIDDFDGDGFKESVTGSIKGDIYVIENNGDDSYSNTFTTSVNTSNAYLNCSTGDIDQNGKKEFFIGASSFWDGVGGTMLFWFEATGDNVYEVQRQVFLKGTSVLGTTEMYSYDINADGVNDLVFAFSYYVVILTWNNNLQLFELYYLDYIDLGESEILSVTVFDLFKNNKPSLFVSLIDAQNEPRWSSFWFMPNLITGVTNKLKHNLSTFQLSQNYPNPFNGITRIEFNISIQSKVNLIIYDLNGKEVKKLLYNQGVAMGRHEVVWNGKNSTGKEMASGVYLYSLYTNNFSQTKKLLYIK